MVVPAALGSLVAQGLVLFLRTVEKFMTSLQSIPGLGTGEPAGGSRATVTAAAGRVGVCRNVRPCVRWRLHTRDG